MTFPNTFGPVNTYSSYLSTEFDVPKEPEEQRKFINARERLTASILNVKTNGNYEQHELLSADQWFTTVVDGTLIAKYGFRFTFDLHALYFQINGVDIPNGASTISLVDPALTIPLTITNITNPLPSYGSATIAGPTYVFTGTDFNVRFDNTNPAAQVIRITNTTGSPFTQAYWVFQYLKQS